MNNNQANKEYLRRIHLATTYICSNLEQPLNLDKIAQVSCFSPFHFHRIFHALTGETVNDFIIRKRMEAAASRLICHKEMSITEVANAGGYSSSANFSKAFKNYFGITPSQIRDPSEIKNSKIGKLTSKYGKVFNPSDLYSQFVTDQVKFDPDKLEEILMRVTIEKLKEKRIAYLTAPKGYDVPAIFETWDRLDNWAKSIKLTNFESQRFAICHDNPMITPTEHCRYDACVQIEDNTPVSEPFEVTTIPSGQYASAYYKGDGDKVSNFYMELYSHWLPNSGFEPDDLAPIAHYLNDTRKDGFVEMNVYIKVKPL
ncbi:AraC family transcriptional regulator [Neptuniibacter sp. SY11_33]|uniref:AraC family transcriptional regulator n=1 Tax=Neptuniibacter sp. SY11_33 TaxID=3398215 RepID=UPI0039F53257